MNYSKPWIFKELSNLCKSGDLVWFEKGVYYIPKKTLLGVSRLNPQKIINKKYICCGDETIGYYSGPSFLYQNGLSTQVPNTLEIFTNNETAKVREVYEGPVRVLLRKSRASINKNNAAVQSFLELMNSVSPAFFDDERKKATEQFILKNNITRSDITKYAPSFPDKALRTLIESEIIYFLT